MRGIYPEKISVIIPVYNEAARVEPALKTVEKYYQLYPNWEFIFVNDGSGDNTEKIIKNYKFIKLISYAKNQGKGYALKQGVKQATKPLVLLCDVDFSTPLTELAMLYQPMLKGVDIVIGSRKVKGAKITKHQSIWREWLGRQFTNLTNLWLDTKVSDATCGFKLFTAKAAKKLFSLVRINRWAYDAEILYLAKKLNFSVKEIPIIWKNDAKTKVNLFKDIIRSIVDLIRIKLTDY